MTWEECTQEPYPAPFEKDMVNCTQGEAMPYCKCKPVMRQMMTVDYICEAKSAVKCETTTKPICTEGKSYLFSYAAFHHTVYVLQRNWFLWSWNGLNDNTKVYGDITIWTQKVLV